mmetsp:Transcript_7627/g.23227  ORF Transcript_7627/g.23227 Transcript_7627/m.23227 type:complete len:1210 (-) Transcript_7627:234-3863(-)
MASPPPANATSPTQTPPGEAVETPPWGWEAYYTTACIVAAFVLMLFDLAKPDMALLGALALILATTQIVTVEEALEGFSNQGLLTVGVLFVVAAGINNTGGLDYYMQRILGAPRTAAAAQFRLMVPVALVSAFLNNTPVVAILIPIVTQWAARIKLAPGQLFIPLSFSSILGGTCTLIGTSTNLVVSGLYEKRFPGQSIGIFDLSPYGVPVMFSGLAYVLLFSPWLLTGGARRKDSAAAAAAASKGGGGELVVAARVRPSSPVVGRTVAEGGLRGLPGLYLISVRRGEMLVRAVGPEFIVAEGDVLHFTGLAEKLGEVAAAYGLEPLHHEHDHDVTHDPSVHRGGGERAANGGGAASIAGDEAGTSVPSPTFSGFSGDGKELSSASASQRFGGRSGFIAGVTHDLDLHLPQLPREVPQELRVRQNLLDRLQLRPGQPLLRDSMRAATGGGSSEGPRQRRSARSEDNFEVNAATPSKNKALEARLFGAKHASRYARSEGGFDRGDGYSALSDEDENRDLALPSPRDAPPGGGERDPAAPQPHVPPPGLRMTRATVRPESSLVGKTPRDVGFRRRYSAAIIALVRRGDQLHGIIGQTPLMAGDVIVMQVSPDSPLLHLINGELPEPVAAESAGGGATDTSRWNFSRIASSFVSSPATGSAVNPDDGREETDATAGGETAGVELSEVTVHDDAMSASDTAAATPTGVPAGPATLAECHADLEIVQSSGGVERDFMIAMRVARGSPIIGKTVQGAGLRGLPGLFLASIERHPEVAESQEVGGGSEEAPDEPRGAAASLSDEEAPPVDQPASPSIVVADRDDKLRVGDVLWFSGELQSVAALRRVPGLVPLEDHQLNKLKVVKADRRLVQAVLAQHSELVGRTAKDAGFRTRYDAVIIAVHRAGERVHHQIGTIRFQPGDVLLLDTGPGFMRMHSKDPAFALVSEIRDSTPPRFHLLYVAGAAAITMIALAVANVLPLFTSALLAAGFMIITGCLTQQQARGSVNWQVIVTIATAFGLSNAMENAGVAGNLSKWLVDAAEATGTGETGLLVAIYMGTIILANIVGNNAAAALMFPVAADAALKAGTDLLNMMFNVMLAASASFASPFGYQTNLMVYGAGGYRFIDFIRFGGPMQLWQLVVSIVVIVLGTPHVFIVWGVAGGLVLLIVFGSSVAKRLGRCGRCGRCSWRCPALWRILCCCRWRRRPRRAADGASN